MDTLLPELHSIESFNCVSRELEYLRMLSREHFINSLTSKQPKVNSLVSNFCFCFILSLHVPLNPILLCLLLLFMLWYKLQTYIKLRTRNTGLHLCARRLTQWLCIPCSGASTISCAYPSLFVALLHSVDTRTRGRCTYTNEVSPYTQVASKPNSPRPR